MKKFLALFLVCLLAMSFPLAAIAEEYEAPETEEVQEEDDHQAGQNNGHGKGQLNKAEKELWKTAKTQLEQEKDLIEGQKEELEAQKEQLEAQLAEAEASGDEALMASIQEQLDAVNEEFAACKQQMRETLTLMHEVMKGQYTAEELVQMELISQELCDQYGVEALPVENVVVFGGNAKFDTPPVIKEGRVLIPVRAITEAMGADVDWDSETSTVTIVKGDITIILDLADGTACVNDEEAEIDVPAQLMNNRTMVPLRFIAENLGLGVEWDEDTQSVELTIEEPAEESGEGEQE